MAFKPRKNTEREMARRCKQVAREVARITSSGQDATTIVYALEEYGRQVEPWAEDVMLKIVEMSDRQNLGMWRELSGKLAEKLQTLTTRWQAVTEDVVKEAEGTPPPPATAVLSNAI